MIQQWSMVELHIPEGIRFDCTGCGNCCLHWPVPATDADVSRIEKLGTPSFRRLPAGDAKMRGFTHTLEKRDDGKCAFLTDDLRCSLHAEHGIEAKPSMCRLFPYSFTPTPSGIYMYVSFASSGVLSNTGRLLTEQRAEMETQLALFQELFPHIDSHWEVQILDGLPLSWDEYLDLEASFIDRLRRKPVLDALIDCSNTAINQLPQDVLPDRLPPVEASPHVIDQSVLQALHQLYWPDEVFQEQSFDFDARALMEQLVRPPSSVTICGGMREADLAAIELGHLAPDIEDLLRRFAYSRIFAKLYFGRSYAHLSVLSGIHHLFVLVALIRLKIKARMLNKQPCSFVDIAEIVRTLERRLTQMNFGNISCTVLEILLSSRRLDRIKQLCL
jgi:Fe-S-cluster containining protein